MSNKAWKKSIWGLHMEIEFCEQEEPREDFIFPDCASKVGPMIRKELLKLGFVKDIKITEIIELESEEDADAGDFEEEEDD